MRHFIILILLSLTSWILGADLAASFSNQRRPDSSTRRSLVLMISAFTFFFFLFCLLLTIQFLFLLFARLAFLDLVLFLLFATFLVLLPATMRSFSR